MSSRKKIINNKPSAGVMFIFITLILDVLGLGLIIPILPELIKEFIGGDSSAAARYFGVIASAYALAQFIFAPILGALSDRVGRRPVLLLALLGFFIDYIILGFAPNFFWLFIGRILAGIMGATVTTANAYIADISTPATRAQNFGLVGAAFGIGFIIGPTLGGLLGAWHIRAPFFVAAFLVLLNLLYGYFVLPESLPKEKRRAFDWRKANPIGAIANLRKYPLVVNLAIAFILVSLAQRGLETVWVLYTGERFGWSELHNGLTLGLVGVMSALVQGYLIRKIIPALGEKRAIVTGLCISTGSFIAFGLAWQGWMMLSTIIFFAFGGIAGPAIQGLVAGVVDPREQGAVQGSLASLVSASSILAPLIANYSFSFFTREAVQGTAFYLPGIPFFIGAIFMGAAALLMWRLFRNPHITAATTNTATTTDESQGATAAPQA